MRKLVFIIFLFSVTVFNSFSQDSDLREVFLAAESYFLFEEFDEALPLYLRIHRQSPDNDNVNFRIGVCYLNNPYEKSKSIYFLERASKNISPRYKEGNFRETSAPQEVLFYLGNAYRVNNEIDKAREYYKMFLDKLDPKIFDDQLVKEQLEILDNAEKLLISPTDLDYSILSDVINTRFSDIRAVISGNEKRMVYVSKLQFYDAVFYTEKINGEWSNPRNIIPELGVDGDVYPTCLSWDGSELYIYRNDDFIGNLYISRLTDGKWTPMVKLNDNINTKYWESHASISKNGNQLYFTSNRKDGYGGLDIYVSERTSGVDWGPALNLGPVLNTKYNEETPFITWDGNKLFFSSYGHFNMGGYDVYVSIKNEDGSWAGPRNLGFPVNTTDDDLFFHPYRNGEYALYSRFKDEGFGRHDIYNYQVYNNEFPRKYLITGYLDYSGEKIEPSDVLISALNVTSKDTISIAHPDDEGVFTFKLPVGTYDLIFNSSKFHEYMKRLEISQTTPHSGMIIPEKISLIPLPPVLLPAELDKMLTLRDTLITVDSDKTVRLRFNADRGTSVIVNVYNDSLLIKSDSVDVTRRRQTYEFDPLPGSNIVEYTLIDKDGNRITKKTEVILEKDFSIPIKKKDADIPEKPVEKIIPEKSKDELIEVYKNILHKNAEGKLKNFIEDIDITKEGIYTREELISYLRDKAKENDYSTDDVNSMLLKTTGNMEFEKFVSELTKVSRGRLRQTLPGIDQGAHNINTPYELIDFLMDNSSSFNYKETDVIGSLSILASGENEDAKVFLEELISLSGENLKKYLQILDPTSFSLNTPEKLSTHVYAEGNMRDEDKKEFARILTGMALNKLLESFRNDLSEIASGNLKNILSELDLRTEGITSTHDLIKYLYDNAGKLNYTTGDIDRLLSELTGKNLKEIENIKKQLSLVSSGQLQKYLRDMDLEDYSFSSVEEFINFLYSSAEKEGFSKDDLNYALLKLAFDGDLVDIIEKMAGLSEDPLKKTLNDLDTKKENITDFGGLIQYLFDNTKKYGYTDEDVLELLEKYFSVSETELLLRKLIRLSQGDLKNFLEDIDLLGLEISDRQHLVNFLLDKANQGIIDKEEVIRLILKTGTFPFPQIISDLKPFSSVQIIKLLEKAEKNKSLFTADQLFDFLLTLSYSTADVSQEDILTLFSDYLRNSVMKLFIDKLSEKATGGLKEALLNPEISNIKSLKDLIDYLLSNAEQYGYTPVDVYNLLQSVLGEENLQTFIDRMIPYTRGNLRNVLINIDPGKQGLTSIEEFIRYIIDKADELNYEVSDIWDAITQMVLSGDGMMPEDENGITQKPGGIFVRNVLFTGGIFALLGIIILFFIWREKKKKKDNKNIV